MDYKLLISLAISARENAYVPYSKFKVGAAVLTETGEIYTGCNIENASYGATICAERVAVFKAVSEGHKNFKALAIIGSNDKYISPCGMCRQVLSEFSRDGKLQVILIKNEEDYIVKVFQELFPMAFTLEV